MGAVLVAAAVGAAAAPAAQAAGKVVNVPLGGDIPAAVAQIGAAGGGTVVLAAGTYSLTAPIVIQSNTVLTGQGSSTIILAPATPRGWSMIQNASEGLTNLTIENLVLDGNIPRGAYLLTSSGTNNPYGGAGIYLFAYTSPITNVLISNVEIRNTGQGILTGTVNKLQLSYDYIHDNVPGSFAHNAYLVASSNVTVSHSRFVNSHGGDGLHFDFGASLYTITKSEFSGNAGEGILDEGNTGISITDSLINYNGTVGIDAYSNGLLDSRLATSYNGTWGIQHLGGSGTFSNIAAQADGSGPFSIFGTGGYGTTLTGTLSATTPNTDLAILATGPLGVADTADWTTQYPGYSSIGAVDFNANHLANGLLTFTNVGAVGAGTYAVKFRYSNGKPGSLVMPVSVNGTKVGTLSFPPTGSWSNWGTISASVRLSDGPNTIAVSAQAAGAPELDYLQVSAPVPAPPAAVCTVAANVLSPYSTSLRWSTVAGASGYSVYRASTASAPFKLLATGLTGPSYNDTSILLGGATYYYNVIAYNQGGAAKACSTLSVTTSLDAPAGLQAATGASGVGLNWMSANGATSYNIKRTISGGTLKTIATIPNTTNLTSTNFEQTYTDSTAVAGTTYSYAVSAVNASGQSADSYTVSVTR